MKYAAMFLPIRLAAGELGIPMTVLDHAAKAGIVPSLHVGGRWLFDQESTHAALVELAHAQAVERRISAAEGATS